MLMITLQEDINVIHSLECATTQQQYMIIVRGENYYTFVPSQGTFYDIMKYEFT